MKILLIIISLLSLSYSIPDHQDTPLEVDKSGNIIGLPEKYQSAKFDFDTRYLRINDAEVTFPDCFEPYFKGSNDNLVYLSASWYHNPEIVPFYLIMELVQEDEEYVYSLMINLETLDFIHLQKVTRTENYVSYPEVELEKECTEDYKSDIIKLK